MSDKVVADLGTWRVRRGGQDVREPIVVELGVPKSVSLAYDIAAACRHNERRAQLAALGLCWEAGPTVGLPARYSAFKCDPLAYAAALEQALVVDRGVPFRKLMEASAAAFNLLGDILPDEEEVKSVEGFSEGDAGPSPG